jgi:hypothetical protein
LQNDHYAHKIKEIISFNIDDYEILLYFNFYILLVDLREHYQKKLDFMGEKKSTLTL